MSLNAPSTARTPQEADQAQAPPAAGRFGRRWRLVAAGLSNVWRFGDLVLDAGSGRLLMRGANGTGKTTALEGMWPYLLDLNPRLLGAGKARQTTWTSLMREGADGARRRIGYAWLTFAAPGEAGEISYGVRVQFSEGASPPVKTIPFRVPGRPVTGVRLTGDSRTALSLDEFTDIITAARGHVFTGDTADDEYVADLAARLLRTTVSEARLLAGRIRQVRNPNLLGDLSPQQAREALREVLPGVADDVITATADALAETAATRAAFNNDRENAKTIVDFAAVWAGHVAEIVRGALRAAQEAQAELRDLESKASRIEGDAGRTATAHERARQKAANLDQARVQIEGRIKGLEDEDVYRAAGALAALERQLHAERETADTTWEALAGGARETREASGILENSLTELREDITSHQRLACEAAPDVAGPSPLVTWIRAPRAVFKVGDRSTDAGPALTITSDVSMIVEAVSAWRTAADAHTSRAEAAALAVADHAPVAAADKVAHNAAQEAAALNKQLDGEERQLRNLTSATTEAAAVLIADVLQWTRANLALAYPPVPVPGPGSAATEDGWDTTDVEALRGAEPGQLLHAADGFAAVATTRASTYAGQLRAGADATDQHAAELRGAAEEHRAEAAQLRGGKLLPLPRPDWAGEGNDDEALGSALEWQPSLSAETRPPLEAALAAAGLLGAALAPTGAMTTAWQVSAEGPVLSDNLTAVLTVDPVHPLAATALAILERVALTRTATASPATTALVVGRDGTFRAGVATGAPALASRVTAWPPARHVGARQRHAAALARALQLDEQAAELERQADDETARAASLQREADEFLDAAVRFPPRDTLRTAEIARASKAAGVAKLTVQLSEATTETQRLRWRHRLLHDEWAERTRSSGLPPTPSELADAETASLKAAHTLRTSAGELADRFAPRFGRLRAVSDSEDRGAELKRLLSKAQVAAARVIRTQGEVDGVRNRAGTAAIEEILEQHRQAEEELGQVMDELGPAQVERDELDRKTVRLTVEASTAHETAEQARPIVSQRVQELNRLLDVPGVADAAFAGSRPETSTLLASVPAVLATVKPYTKKTLRDRYDEARAHLAGSWGLGSGDPLGELDTYVLSYGDDSFTPPQAAAHATGLSDSAEAALAVAEEKALRDFVVGMLPAAIRTGWVSMHDWTNQVNRKMRAAAASSQLSVQVRITLAGNMPEHTRTVYELACNVFEGDRTAEQDAAVSKALQALINAADGATMAERVAAAVNVRDWVDITYEIHRPDGTTVNWTPRTGLSGGERRLVVLAPMLAAIAAGYDRLGENVLRLAALDEVPAEVERARS